MEFDNSLDDVIIGLIQMMSNNDISYELNVIIIKFLSNYFSMIRPFDHFFKNKDFFNKLYVYLQSMDEALNNKILSLLINLS